MAHSPRIHRFTASTPPPRASTSVDTILLPGVIGATIEGPRTPIRSPSAHRAQSTPIVDSHHLKNVMSPMNNNLMGNSGSHYPGYQASSLPGTPKRDRSRYVDTDNGHSVNPATVPRLYRSGSEINPVYTSVSRVDNHGRSSPAQAQMQYQPTTHSTAYRINYSNNGLESDAHDAPYSYHASVRAELTQGGPDHLNDANFSQEEYDNDQDDEGDYDDSVNNNNHHEQQRINHVSSPRRRTSSQESPQIVPVSQESDLDQNRTYGRGPNEHRDYTFQRSTPEDYEEIIEHAEDDYEDEGLDVGDMDDELYSRRLPPHAYNDADESGDEENKEHKQLTFLHRITKTFTSLLEDLGQGTPKHRYRGGEDGDNDSDLGMEATSARARRRAAKRQRIPPVSPSKRKSHAFIAAAEKAAELASSFATAAKTSGELEVPPTKKSFSQVPSMRHIDSGIGMSFSNEEDEAYHDEEGDPDVHEYWEQELTPTTVHRQDYADDLRGQHTEKWRTAAEYESTESTTEDDSPQPFSIAPSMRDAQLNRPRRSYANSGSPAPTRVYPWHVIWYWIQTYSRRFADTCDSFITAVQTMIWWLMCWIYFVVSWPWIRRHDIRRAGKVWMEAGVSSGLLSPKTLAGVALIILAVWAQYSYTVGKEDPLVTPLTNDTLQSDSNAQATWHVSSLFDRWGKSLWQTTPKSDWEESSSQLDMSWLSRWVPILSSKQKAESRIQIPADQIHSLEDLEARIEWIQKTLVELGRAEESREKSVAERIKAIGWDDFLNENQRAIEKFVEGRITKVSKTVLLSLLKSEANSITQGLEKNVIAQLEKKGKLQNTKAVSKTGYGSPTTGEDKGGRPFTEDEIRGMIDKALEKYSADGTAKPDYALFSAGGRVIPRLTSKDQFRSTKPTFWGRIGGRFFVPPPQDKGPQKAIEPSMHAGECWAMRGHQGDLAIRLARKIIITEITIEQADPSIVLDKGSSPREIEIWSLVGHEHSAPVSSVNPSTLTPQTVTNLEKDVEQSAEDPEKSEGEATNSSPASDSGASGKDGKKDPWWGSGIPWPGGVLLSTIEYAAESSVPIDEDGATPKKPKPMQIFSVPLSMQSVPSVGVLLRINSNWGHPEFTCLYRVRVHGYEPTNNESAH